MDNNNIQPIIKFPNKMEVHSPAIDSLKESTRTITKIISEHLVKIAEGIQSLKELPNLFKELKELVAKQFSNLFIAQVEADIMNRQANVSVLEKKLGFVKTHIEKKEEQVEKTNKQIIKRYGNISKEVVKEHELFLKKLDSHVYTITDQIYPKHIQERFSYDPQTNIDYISNHTVESAYIRSKCITDSFVDSVNAIDNFLERRASVDQDISNLNLDTDLEEGVYDIPIWYADVVDTETNKTTRKLFYPWSKIDSESELMIDKMTEEKIDEHVSKNNVDEKFKSEIISWLGEQNISEKMIKKFEDDCHLILMED